MPAATARVIDPVNNSLSLLIRDNIIAVLKALPYFVNFRTWGRTKQFPVLPESLPYCGVYLVNDGANPDGDANAGPPKFSVSARIGFSVWIKNNDPDMTENQLDGAFRAIMNGLLTVPTVYNAKNAPVEGFTRYTRSHNYGTLGTTNECPAAELRFELTCFYREYYEFVAVDDLKVVHLETQYPSPEEADEVQQIEAIWDIPQ